MNADSKKKKEEESILIGAGGANETNFLSFFSVLHVDIPELHMCLYIHIIMPVCIVYVGQRRSVSKGVAISCLLGISDFLGLSESLPSGVVSF